MPSEDDQMREPAEEELEEELCPDCELPQSECECEFDEPEEDEEEEEKEKEI